MRRKSKFFVQCEIDIDRGAAIAFIKIEDWPSIIDWSLNGGNFLAFKITPSAPEPELSTKNNGQPK